MATRKLIALGVLFSTFIGVAACGGDGEVVLPSDTKPPQTTNASEPLCSDVLASMTTTTTTTNPYVHSVTLEVISGCRP